MAPERDRSPVTPPRLALRIRHLQQRIRAWGTSSLLITNATDIRYLTGFEGEDSWALVPARSAKLYVLSDFRYEEQIRREAPHVMATIRKESLVDELVKLTTKHQAGRIALQSHHTTLSMRKMLVKKLGARRLVGVEDQLLNQRSVKDQKEVALIQKAAAIQQDAFQKTIAKIKPGQTEHQICALLEYTMRSLGADGTSFPSIVAADANASLPHAIPGRKKVRAGGILLIDWGARFRGYCADLTRVVALGKMPSKIKQIYQIVLEAQLAAIDAIKPGKPVKEVDQVARDIIANAGYGDQFGHGLGHGVGLDIHEQPVLSERSEAVLEPGHVVTVEPGIYLPGVGGVRIEDDVLVTARGRRLLTHLPKSLDSVII